MERNLKKICAYLVITLSAMIVLGYGYFEARDLIYGPKISILSPENGAVLNSPLTKITGRASNISYISLDDRQIYVDDKGRFSEDLLLANGYNAIKIEAKDKFGRTIEKVVEVIHRE